MHSFIYLQYLLECWNLIRVPNLRMNRCLAENFILSFIYTCFFKIITVFIKVKVECLWTIVRALSQRWFLWRNMRFCFPFKEFPSSLYYCDSLSECKAIWRYSLWTAGSDLIYQTTLSHGFFAHTHNHFLYVVWQILVIIL